MIGYISKIASAVEGKPTPRTVGASLFTRDKSMGLEELPFDLLIDESHGLDFDVSDHAIENGVTLSDNIVQRLRQVSVTGLFTNHSVNGKDSYYSVEGGEAKQTRDKVEIYDIRDDGTYEKGVTNTAWERWQKLQEIAREKRTVHLICSLEDYPALVITNLSAQRGPTDGEAVKFTMRLREIRTVSTKTATVTGVWNKPDTSTAEGRAMSQEQNAGSQTAQDATAKAKDLVTKGNPLQAAGGK